MKYILALTLTILAGAAVAQSFGGGIWQQQIAAAPPPGTPCTNQLVFDYSNSCALMAQAWGQ